MKQLTTIDIYGEQLSFSAGHFTIFSPAVRERLHGHNYHISASVKAEVQAFGISFNYEIYKEKIVALCQEINIYFLLPGKSQLLTIEEEDQYYYVHFNGEKIPFLKTDVVILPVTNISLEELARWFLERLVEDQKSLKDCLIHEIILKVSSGHGRSASASWGL